MLGTHDVSHGISVSWLPASPPGNQHPISVLHVDRAYPGEVTEARLDVAAQDHLPSLRRVSGDDRVVEDVNGRGDRYQRPGSFGRRAGRIGQFDPDEGVWCRGSGVGPRVPGLRVKQGNGCRYVPAEQIIWRRHIGECSAQVGTGKQHERPLFSPAVVAVADRGSWDGSSLAAWRYHSASHLAGAGSAPSGRAGEPCLPAP